MLLRHAISDADWDRIKHLLPGQPGNTGGVAEDNRRFLDAVLWIARTGAAWGRELASLLIRNCTARVPSRKSHKGTTDHRGAFSPEISSVPLWWGPA